MNLETGPTWLHNMSVASKTVITHQGRSIESLREIVFEFPHRVEKQNLATMLMLKVASEGAIRNGLNRRAAALPYPAVALIVPSPSASDAFIETDLLTICTVLSKSSERVYLRDKEPNLPAIKPGRRVVLAITGAAS